jgi:hypothetical protein
MTHHPTDPGKIAPGGGETAETDILAEARAALTATKCTDQMQDFFRVGLVRELRGLVEQLRSDYAQAVEDWGDNDAAVLAENARLADEVERLRGALANISSSCARELRAVLRGDQ